MTPIRVYADFQNADPFGRLRLNTAGTIEDLARQRVELSEGLLLSLYADDLDDEGQLDELIASGIAHFSDQEGCWVAAIDWNAVRHSSEKMPGLISEPSTANETDSTDAITVQSGIG